MFHIGRIEKVILPRGKGVISADATVQAVVKMWDDNLLMLEVDKKIAADVREKDYAIADYTPIGPESPHRKMIITKIVKGELGKEIWGAFEKEYETSKNRSESGGPHMAPVPMPYIR